MKPDSIVGHAKVLLNETKDFVDCDFTCTKMNYLTKIRIFNVTHFKPQWKTEEIGELNINGDINTSRLAY